MLQPFHYMVPQVLNRLKLAGNIYFVSQSYERGRNEILLGPKESVLFSHYNDKGLAEIHFKAIHPNDKYRSIIDLGNEEHKAKLLEMLLPESPYVVYAKLIRTKAEDLEKMMKEKYFDNVARYIQSSTTWNLGKNKFSTRLEIIFGELFLEIKLHNQKVRVKFDEIENS